MDGSVIREIMRLDDTRNYVRDSAGVWRYRRSHARVPGAMDAAIVGQQTVVVRGPYLLLPTALARGDELSWAQRFPVIERHHLVPVEAWRDARDDVVQLWAREHTVDRLIEFWSAAERVPTSREVFVEAVNAGDAPAPAYRIDGVLHWTGPVLDDWYA
jgi:hypothetical protein